MHAVLSELLAAAVRSGKLLEASRENIALLLSGAVTKCYGEAILELAEAGEWTELNDRFFRTLTFGTGGLRGRTIGRVITRVERGHAGADAPPEFPCVGTHAMNFYQISRATRGLAEYVWQNFLENGYPGRPKVVICHDTRYFSRDFAEFAAHILCELGCDALLFREARSTPQLSFAIRHCGAQAGINLTASHNPPAYNGYKVYFADGGQIVEPHASRIIACVRSMKGEAHVPLPKEEHGRLLSLGTEIDAAYSEALQTLVIEPSVFTAQSVPLRIVFSPLHGTGGAAILPVLQRLGVDCSPVEAQCHPDGGFPTVESPNPEERSALDMGLAQAAQEGADLVLATDPDADRLGVAVRRADGELELLTGNQIGSILAWHRLSRLFAHGILHEGNRHRATLIKTFVTTDLQKAIAGEFGVRCVETLTGFKYIGAKLKKYEDALPAEVRTRWASFSESEKRDHLLQHSTWFVFGGEESYGYSASDFVRDKDANGAAVMVAEAAAYARGQGRTLLDLLDTIYLRHGVFLERGESLVMEGADGAVRIAALVESYTTHPPQEMAGRKVESVINFAQDAMTDSEGDLIPKESMMLFTLSGGFRVAVRPSGTEPKIKFYLFGAALPPDEQARGAQETSNWTLENLGTIKERVRQELAALWQWLREDVQKR